MVAILKELAGSTMYGVHRDYFYQITGTIVIMLVHTHKTYSSHVLLFFVNTRDHFHCVEYKCARSQKKLMSEMGIRIHCEIRRIFNATQPKFHTPFNSCMNYDV